MRDNESGVAKQIPEISPQTAFRSQVGDYHQTTENRQLILSRKSGTGHSVQNTKNFRKVKSKEL